MDKKLLMMALLMTTGLATHAQEKLTRYQVRNAITVRTPIMNDSINPKGEKHTAKALLQTPVVLDLANAPTQMTAADTAGLVTFAKADKDNLLYLIKTQLRAERFMKGKLKVTSPVRWEPVSYTHLDVYKRQDYHIRKNIGQIHQYLIRL